MKLIISLIVLFTQIYSQINELNLNLLETIPETREEYFLVNPYSLCVNKQKEIYVFDSGEFNLKKFDKNFNYQSTFSGKGKGPGEFIDKIWFMNTNDNYLVAADPGYNDVNIFSDKDKYLTKFRAPWNDLIVENMVIGNDNNLYFTTNTRLRKHSINGDSLKSIHLDCFLESTTGGFSMREKFLFEYNNKLYLLHNTKYSIEVYNYNLDLISEFGDKNYRHIRMGEKEYLKYGGFMTKDEIFKIFENALLIDNYLLLYFRPRELDRFRQRIEIWDLEKKLKVYSGYNEDYKVFKLAKYFGNNEVISIAENEEGIKEVRKYKLKLK